MAQHWWAFERGILYAIELGEVPLVPVSPRLLAHFKEVSRESAEQLAAAMGLADARPVLTRLATGRRCFGAWIGGGIAAYGWVSHTAECIGEQEREIRMPPRVAYIWDCATLPEYRGQRLYSALLSHMVAALGEEGVRRVWIGTALGNKPSLRGFVNAGFRPVLTLVYARLSGVHFLLETGDPAAARPLIAAARRAVASSYERAWGPVIIGWSPPAPPPPCAEMEA